MANELKLYIGDVAGSTKLGTAPSQTGPFEPLELVNGAAGIRFDYDSLTLTFRPHASESDVIEVYIDGSRLGTPPISSRPIQRAAFPVTVSLRRKGGLADIYSCVFERQAAAAEVKNKPLDLIETSDDSGGDGASGPGQGHDKPLKVPALGDKPKLPKAPKKIAPLK